MRRRVQAARSRIAPQPFSDLRNPRGAAIPDVNAPDEKVNWDREHPPVPLTGERAQSLLSPWLRGARVTDATLLKGGLTNRNVEVRLDRAPFVCVLRLYDANPAACAKEAAILGLLARDVPVPDVLYVNPHGDGAEPPFVVLSKVGGVSLVALRRAGEVDAVAAVSYDVGRVLARIAAHRFSRAGALTATLGIEDFPFDQPVTTATLVGHFADSPTFQRRLGMDAIDRLRRFALEWEPAFADRLAAASLVHGDYNSPNIFGQRVGDTWRVSAILDWEFAFSGPSWCDIGNVLRYHRADRPRYEPDFSRGLRDGGISLPNDWLAVARFADLPALCELLGREHLPDAVVRELRELLLAVIDGRDI